MPLFNYYPSDPRQQDTELEKKIFRHSLFFPAFFVIVFILVKVIESILHLDFSKGGIYPLHLIGLPGILFSPFIHGDYNHLVSNSVPFFILFFALIYFYRRISYQIFILIYFISGICVWFGGRESWHIGASGVVYGLAAFHFISGLIRSDLRLLTIAAIVVFLYGGMIWGIFPLDPKISWESHLWGGASGVILAVFYRNYKIRRHKFDWEEEEEDEDELHEEEEEKILNTSDNKSDTTISSSGNY